MATCVTAHDLGNRDLLVRDREGLDRSLFDGESGDLNFPIPLSNVDVESCNRPKNNTGILRSISESSWSGILTLSLALSGLFGFTRYQGRNFGREDNFTGGAVASELLSITDSRFENLVRSERQIICLFHNQKVIVELDSESYISSVQIGERICVSTTPIAPEYFQTYISNFYDILELSSGNSSVKLNEVKSFTTRDGVRFDCSVGGGDEHVLYSLSDHRIYMVSSDFDKSLRDEYQGVKNENSDFKNKLKKDIESQLSSTQKQTFHKLEESYVILSRFRNIERSFSTLIEQYSLHPFLRESYDRKFEEWKDSEVRKRCQDIESALTRSDYLNSSLSQSETDALVEMEEYLGLDIPEIHFGIEELARIAERVERTHSINNRANVIRSLFVDKTKLEPDKAVYWQERSNDFNRAWNLSLSAFGNKGAGWPRWDPKGLSQEQHRSVMQELSSVLRAFENELEIDSINVDEHLAIKHQEIQSKVAVDLAREENLKEASSIRTLVDIKSGHVINEFIEGGAKKQDIRRYTADQTQITERYTAGKPESISRDVIGGNSSSSSTFHDNGKVRTNSEWRLDSGRWILIKQERFRADGTKEYISNHEDNLCRYYDKSGTEIFKVYQREDGSSISRIVIVESDGSEFGLYPDELKRSAGLSRQAYLNSLAKRLDTQEKLHYFLEICMRYTSDGDRDTWQTSTSTLSRYENGKMLGDCDDYAFLARDILKRQGYKPHVIYIPGHAVCVWVTKRADGRYDGHSIDTYGYDCNGNRYGYEEDITKQHGYPTIREALNSLMRKYRYKGLGISKGQDFQISGDKIQVIDVREGGSKIWSDRSINHLLVIRE